jgi:hypothetical protein
MIAAAAPAPAQLYKAQTNSTGGAGAIDSGGAGMIGGPSATAGTRGTGVIKLHDQPHNPAPPPPTGAGYGTPGNAGNNGITSNSGTGTGVESDIRTGITTSPNTR